VTRALLFTWTTVDGTKLVPVTVTEDAGEPVTIVFGESKLIVGSGLLTVSVAAGEVPPPGVGFTTVTARLPVVLTSTVVS
jgi:hypothetical protein